MSQLFNRRKWACLFWPLICLVVFCMPSQIACAEVMNLSSSVEAFATDQSGDFIFDIIGLSNGWQDVIISSRRGFDDSFIDISRPFFEFDLDPVSGFSRLNSATLLLRFAGCSACRDPMLVYGYAGDGIAAIEDADQNNLIGTMGPGPSEPVLDPFFLNVTVNVADLLSSGENYAGFMLRYPNEGGPASENRAAQIATSQFSVEGYAPLLIVDFDEFTIPEPGTILLFNLCLTGLGIRIRKPRG